MLVSQYLSSLKGMMTLFGQMDNLRARAGKIQSEHRIYCARKQGGAQRMVRTCQKDIGASLTLPLAKSGTI